MKGELEMNTACSPFLFGVPHYMIYESDLISVYFFKGLIQILDQVIYIFYPHRYSDQRVGYSNLFPDLRRHGGMGHTSGMFDQ